MALRRRASRNRPPINTLARRLWHEQVVRGQRCVMCKAFPVASAQRRVVGPELAHRDAHHIVEKGELRRDGHLDHLWDRRNGLCLCRYHHFRHHSRAQPVPRDLLPAAAFEFAAELGLLHAIERAYPERVSS